MIPGNTSSQGKYVDPPTSVSASAGNAQATVTFTLPIYDGKETATYVVTSSPSGITASGASSPITVTGLSNGTSYIFTVTTISGYGVSAVSTASSAVTPVAPPQPQPVAPQPQPVAPQPQPVAPQPQPAAPQPQPAAPQPQPAAPQPQPAAPQPVPAAPQFQPQAPQPVAYECASCGVFANGLCQGQGLCIS